MKIHKPKHRRGATLATVLLLTGVVAVLAFALAGASITNLHLSYRSSNSDAARDLAESTISVALDAVLADNDLGRLRLSTDVVELPGLSAGSSGFLSFNESASRARGIPYSTNNLESDAAKPGAAGRVVPSHSLHLVSRGEHNGSIKTVEAIFHLPKFPFVVATSGKFETTGETLVDSVEGIDELVGPRAFDDENLKPGHVASNSSAADAIQFGPLTKITGDAKAAGGVQLQSGATVLGQIKPNSDSTEIPTYEVSDFDPEATGKLGIVHLHSGVVNRPNYEGWVRRDGDLHVTNGLHLDNAVLYVEGNLEVSGGVTGTGALLINGDTHISGRSRLTSDNLAAIVSDGDVSLQGMAGSESVFRGLVYTNQSLVAQDITLVGTLLVAGSGGSVTLKDSKVVYSPDSASVNLRHRARTALHFVAPSGARPGTYLGTKQSDHTINNKIRIFLALDSDGTFLVYRDGTPEADAIRAATAEEALNAVRNIVSGGNSQALLAFDNTTSPKLTDLISGLQSGAVLPEEEEVDLLELDPSQMLGLADKLRLVMLREL